MKESQQTYIIQICFTYIILGVFAVNGGILQYLLNISTTWLCIAVQKHCHNNAKHKEISEPVLYIIYNLRLDESYFFLLNCTNACTKKKTYQTNWNDSIPNQFNWNLNHDVSKLYFSSHIDQHPCLNNKISLFWQKMYFCSIWSFLADNKYFEQNSMHFKQLIFSCIHTLKFND